jgi:5-methylcytosine-specific restriction enzyme A
MPMKPPSFPGVVSRNRFWRPSAPRMRGRKLQAARSRLLALQPLCASCGRILLPDRFVRDHITPLAEQGPDTEANTQALCPDCHDRKTQEDTRRGQIRHTRRVE